MTEKENEVTVEEQATEQVVQETEVSEEETKKEEVVVTSEEATEEPAVEETVVAEQEDEDDAQIILPEEEEFDWNEVEGYSKEERARMEKLYEGTLHELKEGEIVKGTVVAIGDKEVILNIGFKSEGIVPLNEFRDLTEMKNGDEVDVYLESVEDKNGQLILSRKRAKHIRTWAMILDAENNDTILVGLVKRRTKGGFVVDIDGIEAFLPGSQIDVKPVRDFDAYVGKTMDFKVVKINHPYENVVISHKVLIEKDLEKQRQEILKNLEKGQVLEGTVKNMTNFGVFIDLGGVDGLLHITDISWGRINHPEEVLELDQKINIVVLDFDDEKKRISLGLKQLEPHPWDSLPEDIDVGSIVKGKVVTVADYGIFIELMPGVEGLVHMSEMSWSQHLKNPTEMFKIGDEVEATVLTIDREERKMSLGLKQTTEDPWLQAAVKYSVGSKHKGIVRNMTNYGLFVELEEGVDGLVHISDLSWTKKFNHPSEFTKKDDELEVIVLEIDVENRRLSLGHKQLTEDVWETFESIFVVGSAHEGTILKADDKGATVELEYGVEGFVPRKHLKVEEGKPEIKAGDKVSLKVIEFDKGAKKLVLSHTLTWNAEMAQAKQKKARSKKSSGSATTAKQTTTTLGEIDALAALKQRMVEQEKGAQEKEKAPEAETPKEEPTPEVEAKEESAAEESAE